MDKKMMAAVEQTFQERFGMDAGWAHNVLFISGDRLLLQWECFCAGLLGHCSRLCCLQHGDVRHVR